MIAAGFSMDLYCDTEERKSSESFIHDDNFRGAKKAARLRGWYFYEDDTKVLCRKCASTAGHKQMKRPASTQKGVSIFELGK